MARAICVVCGPRFFSKTMPSWFTMKVMIPEVRPIWRGGQQGKAARHPAGYDVVLLSARRMRALACQDAVVVAVIGRGFIAVGAVAGVALGARARDQRTQRALRLALRCLPVQAVVLAGAALQARGGIRAGVRLPPARRRTGVGPLHRRGRLR